MNQPASSRLTECSIPGVQLIQSTIHMDDRGVFREMVRKESILQINYSMSHQGVIRGLHIQKEKPQGKYISVVTGKIMDVFVDCRKDSPTFGQWDAIMLQGDKGATLYLPPGIAHGFCSLSQVSCMVYGCTENLYDPELDGGIRYDDPKLGIDWPYDKPMVSAKDKMLPMWDDYLKELR